MLLQSLLYSLAQYQAIKPTVDHDVSISKVSQSQVVALGVMLSWCDDVVWQDKGNLPTSCGIYALYTVCTPRARGFMFCLGLGFSGLVLGLGFDKVFSPVGTRRRTRVNLPRCNFTLLITVLVYLYCSTVLFRRKVAIISETSWEEGLKEGQHEHQHQHQRRAKIL